MLEFDETYDKGIKSISPLSQSKLRQWLERVFVFGSEPYFEDEFYDIRPSEVFRAVLYSIDKASLDDDTKLNLRNRLHDTIVEIFKSRYMNKGADEYVVHELLNTVEKCSIYESAGILSILAQRRKFEAIADNGPNLQYYLLKLLPLLHTKAKKGKDGFDSDRSIIAALETNIKYPQYTLVCFDGLMTIDNLLGWKHLTALVAGAIANININLTKEFKKVFLNFLSVTNPEFIYNYFEAFVRELVTIPGKVSYDFLEKRFMDIDDAYVISPWSLIENILKTYHNFKLHRHPLRLTIGDRTNFTVSLYNGGSKAIREEEFNIQVPDKEYEFSNRIQKLKFMKYEGMYLQHDRAIEIIDSVGK